MTDPRIEAAAMALMHTDNYDMEGFSQEQFRKALASKHHGDCIKISCTCMRCLCEQAISEASSILAAADAAAWRPIETAPRDGSYLMCYCNNDEIHLLSSECPNDFWRDRDGYYQIPTHWQPLADPPEGEVQGNRIAELEGGKDG